MKIFMFSAFVVSLVAITSAQGRNGYAPNNGVNSPGTFNEKMGDAGMNSDVSRETVPDMRVTPETMNTSPNPTPELNDGTYGDTISTKGSKKIRQAQEEKLDKSKNKPNR